MLCDMLELDRSYITWIVCDMCNLKVSPKKSKGSNMIPSKGHKGSQFGAESRVDQTRLAADSPVHPTGLRPSAATAPPLDPSASGSSRSFCFFTLYRVKNSYRGPRTSRAPADQRQMEPLASVHNMSQTKKKTGSCWANQTRLSSRLLMQKDVYGLINCM